MNGDFELEIGSGSRRGEYTVRVIRAPAGGEPSGRFQLDIDEVLDRRADLENTILATAVPARRAVPAAEKPLHDVGQHLFQTVFTGPVNGTYRASLGAAQQDGRPLRVVLRLATPELAALPWEMLFDPETESYLCRTRPLLRHIPAADYHPTPLEVAPPLRILGIVAAPRDLPALDTDAEKHHLTEALAEPIAAGRIELVWAPRATWEGIQTQLLAGPWHVLHFIGHGDYDTHGHEGRIALVADDGRAAMIESSRLTDLLDEAEPTPRLVVLNSCSSGQAGEDDLFAGTAAALVRGGVNAVAAMQFTVSDTAAIAFARGFYTAMAIGRDVDKAAHSGRVAILGHGSLEWVTPVLYVRGGSTRLFTLTGSPVPDEITNPVRPELPPTVLRAMYIEARGELRRKRYESAVGLFDDLLTLAPDYKDAAALRNTAQRSRELADIYQAARTAEDAGDWESAARGYAQVQSDPDFPDAADRRQACEHQQQIADLQEELRFHADAENWQTVLDVDTELAALDPDAADPDGLTTHAQSALHYTKARAAEDTGDWTTAAHEYAQAQSDPDGLTTHARSALVYAEARRAEEAEDWETAAQGYARVQADPSFPDAQARQRECELKLQPTRAGATEHALTQVEKDLPDLPADRNETPETLRNEAHAKPADHPPDPQQKVAPSPTIAPGIRLWRKTPSKVRAAVLAVLAVTIVGLVVYATQQHATQTEHATQTVLDFTGLINPVGVAVNTAGDVYVADNGNDRVLKLAGGSGPQTVLDFTGLEHPTGVAVNMAGDVYATDTGNNRVLKLPGGSGPQTVLDFTGLEHPTGVAVNTAGDVYATDTGNHRVLKLAGGSGPQTVLDSTGLNDPVGLAVSTAGDVYVADNGNHRVLKLAGGSGPQTVLDSTGLDDPEGLAVNTAGDVYVADFGNDRVLKLAAAGSSTPTELHFTGLTDPAWVAVDTAGDVYAADTGNDRVVKLPDGG
ncbi:MAG: CHAT domain-containing protein [Rhodococcus sp. (in: high G+C Gram-positive bacteria)]|nr:MAG: CHAT domain-containing protein [Rhodococcus sp. (in: high G+C Gram-positive bacteria)]